MPTLKSAWVYPPGTAGQLWYPSKVRPCWCSVAGGQARWVKLTILFMGDSSTLQATGPSPKTQPLPPSSQTPSNQTPLNHHENYPEIPSLMNIESERRLKHLDSVWQIEKFDRFIKITPKTQTVSFKDCSPFKLSKALKVSMKHPIKSVQKEATAIVVEVETAADSEALLKVNSFLGEPVEVAPHVRLNSSRGVIRSWDFKNATPEEWRTVPGIIDARQIVSRKGGVEKKTPLWVLTFDTPILPSHVKVEYTRLDVRPYIRRPLRCFKCQVSTVRTVTYAFNAAKPKSILTARKNPGVQIAGLLDTMRPQKIAQNLLKKKSSLKKWQYLEGRILRSEMLSFRGIRMLSH